MSQFGSAVKRVIGVWIAAFWLAISAQAAVAQIAPSFSMQFTPDEVTVGNLSTLNYTITNNDASGATNVAMIHGLSSGLTIQNLISTNNCGFDPVSAPSGGNTITLSGGQIAPGSACTFSVSVNTNAVGVEPNTAGPVTSSLGSSTQASDNLTVLSNMVSPQFSHSFNPSTVPFGGRSTLTYTFDNTANPSNVVGLLSETLPAGLKIDESVLLTNTCGGSASSDAGAGTVSLNSFVQALGTSCSLSLAVIPNVAGTIDYLTNGYTYGQFFPSDSTGPSFAALTVSGAAAGAPLLVKEFTNDPVVSGDMVNVRYDITNTNRDFAATGISFTDDLDAAVSGMTLNAVVSNTCGGTVSGMGTGSLSFSGATLAANGASCSILVTNNLGATSAGSYPAPTSAITATADGVTVTGLPSSDTLIVNAVAPPSVTTSFTDAVGGGTTSYSVTISNNAMSTVSDIAFDFPISVGVPITGVTSSPGGNSCGAGSDGSAITFGDPLRIVLTAGELAAGANCTLTWTLQLADGAPTGSYDVTLNNITATAGGTAVLADPSTATLNVGGALDVAFSKVFASASVVPGAAVDLNFSIEVPLEPGITAINVSFTDDLSAMLAGTTANTGSATSSCGGSVTGSSVISVAGATIAAGETCIISVPVTIDAAAATGTVTNTTSILSATPSGSSTPETFSSATANLTVTSLAATASFTPSTILPGQDTELSITLQNDSASAATGAVLTFSISELASGSAISSAGATTDTCGGNLSGTTFGIYTGGTIPANGSCTITATISTPAGAGAGVGRIQSSSFSASINGSGVTGENFIASLNFETRQIDFAKSFSSATAEAGSTVTVLFDIENLDTTNAVSNISFQDDMAAFLPGVTLGSAPINTCSATVSTPASGLISVSGGALAAGASCQISVEFVTPVGTTGTFDNVTTGLTGVLNGFGVTGDAAQASLELISPDLPTFTASFAPASVPANGSTTVTYQINNPIAGSSLTGLQFTHDLNGVLAGAVATPVATACGAGSSLTGGGTVAFTAGSLAPGESCTLTATVAVPFASASVIAAPTSPLTASGLEVAAAAPAAFSVISVAPQFAQAVSPGSIAQGATSTLTYTVNNSANADPVTGVAFAISLPSGVSVAATPAASNTCGGMISGGAAGATSFSFAGGQAAAAGSCTVQIDVTSATTGPAAFAPAVLSSSFGAASSGATTLTVTPAPQPLFTAAFAPSAVVQGAPSTLTFTVNNTALVPANALAFSTPLTGGLQVASPLSASTTCVGGSVSAAVGGTSVSLSSGTVAASGSCVVVVQLATPTAGLKAVTSGDLTSDLGNSGPASANLNVSPAPAPVVTAAMAPTSFAQGEVGTVTVTFNNSAALVEATALAITGSLPADVEVAAPSNVASTCALATATAAPGASTVSLAGATVPSSGSCTFSFDVTSETISSASFSTGAVNSSLGASTPATALIAVTAAPAPMFSAAFAPSSIEQGQTSVLSFSIDNSAAAIPAAALAFTNTLPAGVVIPAAPASASTTCTGGAVVAVAGSNQVTFSVGSLADGASCVVNVPVTAATVLTGANTSGDLTSSLGNSGPASATLNVTAAPAPGFTAAFAPASIPQGDVTRLTYTIDNLSASVPATAAEFTNTLPGDLRVADPAGATTTCSAGTVTAVPGSASVAFAGGTIDQLTSCFVHVNVTAANVGTTPNTTGVLNTSLGSSGTAASSLTVTPAPLPTLALSIAPTTVEQGGAVTVTGEIGNTALVPANLINLSVPFPAGVEAAAPLNFSSTCNSPATGPASGPGLGITAASVAASSSCTFSFDVRVTTVGATVLTTSPMSTSLGSTAAASATVTTTAAGIPVFTAAFAPATIVQGDVSTLSLMIDNSANLIEAENGAFDFAVPAGLQLASAPNPQASCTIGAAIGTPVIAGDGSSAGVTGIEVAAGAVCTYSIDISSATAGSTTLVTSALQTTLGNSGAAAAILNVNLASVPDLSAAYVPDTVVQGATSTLTFTIDNTGTLIEVVGLGFDQTLPTGVVIAPTPNAATTCSAGTVAAAAAGTTLAFSGGTVDAEARCTVSVDVVPSLSGAATATSSVLASGQGAGAAGAAATLNVTGAPVPLFSAAYTPDSIVQGGQTVLTYSIDNTAALVDATGLSFSETLPDAVTIATTPNASTTCAGGTVTAAAAGSTIGFAGGTATTGGICTISVSVTSPTVGDVTGTSGDLTSDLGNSGPASATLSVTAADGPSFAKAFAPDTVVQGEVSTLTFSIDNATALVPATAIAFNDPMPDGMIIADTPNVTSTCSDGTVTAQAGSGVISLERAMLDAAANCAITVDVVLITAGTSTNVTEDLTSSLGNSGPATAQLTATPATPPTFAKAFAPTSIAQGEVSRLVLTIDNAAAAVDVTDLAFTDNFPDGLTIATAPNATTTCGAAALTAGAATATLAMSGGTVAAGATCEVGVNVTATSVGDYANTSGDLTSSLGNSGAASATLSVTPSAAPLFNSQYSPPSIVQGGTSRLILTVDNTGGGVGASGLGFDVTLPSGLFVDGSTTALAPNARPDLANTCGGTAVGEPNATTVSLSGGSVGAAATCTVSVNVTSEVTGTLGPVTGNLRSSLGDSTLAADTTGPLVVEANPEGQLTIIQNASEDGTFIFSSTQAALNFSITTTGGSGSSGAISVPLGTYVIQQARPEGVGNTALSCSDGDSGGDASSGTLTVALASNETVVCTFTSLSTQQKTTEVINSFLNRRNNLILSNGPSRARRLDRLRHGVGGSQTLTYQNGDLKSFAPASFNLLSAGSGNYSLSTSLYQVERAALMFGLAHDGIEGNSAIYNPRRFDIWFEAHYSEFKASQGSSGHFGIAYLGADYLVTPDVLAGAMLQFDTMNDNSAETNSSVSGRGWMFGPYVTARLAPNLIFDGRISYGKSVNQIRPFNTYEDEFDTDRFLIDASLSGSYDWDDWVVTPNLSISYIEERQKAYTDSLNVAIPGQTVSLGQIKFGPTFSTQIKGRNHTIIEPSFTVNGIYNFGNRSGPVITNNTADETDGLRARVEAGVRITGRYGTQVEFGANYDGIGANDFESWGANFKLTVPLQRR